MTRILPLLVLPLLALASCEDRAEDGPEAEDGPLPPLGWPMPETPESPPHLMDPARLVKGDTVLGMAVSRVAVDRASGDPDDWVGRVLLRGRVTLSGWMMEHFDPGYDAVCFRVDESSRHKLPRFPNDERIPWFCFANGDEARRMLGPERGSATLTIDGYDYYFAHTDVVNQANLVEVSARDTLAEPPPPGRLHPGAPAGKEQARRKQGS